MAFFKTLLIGALSLAGGACSLPADAFFSQRIERHIEETFRVGPDSLVKVKIHGGSIVARQGEDGAVRVKLTHRVDAGSDQEADEILKDYSIIVAQDGREVTVSVERKSGGLMRLLSDRHASFSAEVVVPARARLDLDTSGGSIEVRGDRQGDLVADTSGGGIRVDGGSAAMELNTSGGGITVGRTLTVLSADTSGGGITVDYVGPRARDVNLDTSGGGIRVGVDRQASLDVTADTSGGRVAIEDLPFRGESSRSRSHASGSINGGGGRLRASTSGGGITIRPATP